MMIKINLLFLFVFCCINIAAKDSTSVKSLDLVLDSVNVENNNKSPKSLLGRLYSAGGKDVTQSDPKQMGQHGVGESKYDAHITSEDVIKIEEIRKERLNRDVKKYSIVTLLILFILAVLIIAYKKKNLFNKSKVDNEEVLKAIASEEQLSIRDISTELIKLNELKEKGIITQEEFSKLKNKILK